MSYDHKNIEKKWQEYWTKNKTFKVENNSSKPWFYCLDMFPYPSWEWLHVWHPKWFVWNDVYTRYKHARGYNVLHPMWWDAFWLPAENFAIKTWTHPRIKTQENIENYRRQMDILWFSYDRDREINTTDPSYYKRTQWIFLKMFEHNLAYEQDLPINYCPACKTWLANEEVLNDFSCERCWTKVEKKKIRQWVLAITKYADRLAEDVDKLDRPEWIKQMQKNWIWRSEGCEFEMEKSDDKTKKISVYTTRIDTVFGMTYAVLAPDHKNILDFIAPEQKETCEAYIKDANSKSDQDRTADDKEKTWVFTGTYVINPFNNEKVPLWIWDYVLWNYGTGAVMAVPAHDERDFEFAKKYGLEIRQSIAKNFEYTWVDAPRKWVETIKRKTIDVILENDKWEICLQVEEHSNGTHIHFIWGWVDDWDTELETVSKELTEEAWYIDFDVVWPVNLSFAYSLWYRANKDKNQDCLWRVFYVKLKSDKQISSEIDEWKHSIKWVKKEDVLNEITWNWHKDFWNLFYAWEKAFTEYGKLVDSGDFSWLTSEEAKVAMTEFAEKNWFGSKKINYKLRDWLFSRQRYWGEPIPLIHIETDVVRKLPRVESLDELMKENTAYVLKTEATEKSDPRTLCSKWKEKSLVIDGKIVSKIYEWIYWDIICDYNLPLELPNVEKYEPAWDWNSPLKNIDSFVNIKLADNLSWKRETNTMPQWWGSCWYFLRFMDPENDKKLISPEIEKYRGNVDNYVWGAEHAVLHLLYARFWYKFLFDIWVVTKDEPFQKLINQWMIQAFAYRQKNWWLVANDLVEERDWKYFHKESNKELDRVVAKMSKSLKNVVNPDSIVLEYGADTFRMYEMYMSEFRDSAPWDTKWIIWVRRFLDRIVRTFDWDETRISKDDDQAIKLLHKSIKKSQEDIENFKFNTCIAQLMILVNFWVPKDETKASERKRTLLKLIHPFSPHLAEELWEKIWNKESIFFSDWPKFDENLVIDDELEIAVQVMWKLRWTILISKDEDKQSILEKAKKDQNVLKFIEWKELVKEIYVPGKIVNLVVK